MRVESFKINQVGILNEIVMLLEIKFYQCAKCGKVFRLYQTAAAHYIKNHGEKNAN